MMHAFSDARERRCDDTIRDEKFRPRAGGFQSSLHAFTTLLFVGKRKVNASRVYYIYLLYCSSRVVV